MAALLTNNRDTRNHFFAPQLKALIMLTPSENASQNRTAADADLLKEYYGSIERNIERRHQTNKFNFTAVGGIAAAIGFLQTRDPSHGVNFGALPKAILICGVVFCILWIFQILRYREVSEIKHQVAIELEEELGVSIFRRERDKAKSHSTVIDYTLIEIGIPLIALGLCGAALLL